MTTIEEQRAQMGIIAKQDLQNPYRRNREYARYVNRFLYSEDIVDGMTFEERINRLPMPRNIYFG